ncbi:hypothetical protein [uncultured Croceitalea sp.]|uniref:hypothetical protein n=1 Tax=uncultured Croceitalea sp. TaxID=1798908 RepID=UPI00330640E9
MNLDKERKIKFWLTIIVKILVGVFVAIQLFYLIQNKFFQESIEPKGPIPIKDTLVLKPSTDSQGPNTEKGQKTRTLAKPEPNTAGIYIFDKAGLDSKIIDHLSKTFFKGYSLKAGGTITKDQLLVGNLSSSANTELVCVGTVNYNFYKNSQEMTTCEVNLTFNTYNKVTGSRVPTLSYSFSESGPGFTNAKALQVAMQKIHP